MINDNNEFKTKRGRGRPKKIEGDLVRQVVWITEEKKDMLDEMMIASGKSKSDLIRRMIQVYYYTNRGKW